MIKTPEVSNPESTTYLIIVMGVSGSGKSTIAKAVADHFDYQFLDADDFHSDENKQHMASGKPLTDEMRLPWVNNIRQHLQLASTRQEHSVLAFSGLRQQHRNILRSAGLRTLVIFLNGDKNTIQQRVNLRKNHFMAPGLVDSQFAALEDPTAEADVVAVDVTGDTPSVAARSIQVVEQYLFPSSQFTSAH